MFQILAQGGGEAPAPGPGGGLFQLLGPIALIFMIFYFLIIRPEGRKRKERQKMISAVKKGDVVVTTGGIVGKVWRVDESEVVVVIDKDRDVKAHFLKSAVYEVVKVAEGAPAKRPPGGEPVPEVGERAGSS